MLDDILDRLIHNRQRTRPGSGIRGLLDRPDDGDDPSLYRPRRRLHEEGHVDAPDRTGGQTTRADVDDRVRIPARLSPAVA